MNPASRADRPSVKSFMLNESGVAKKVARGGKKNGIGKARKDLVSRYLSRNVEVEDQGNGSI